MPDQYRVTFVTLAADVDTEVACANLAAKLKTSEDKVTAFFNAKPLFAPCIKEKALKQVKLLSSLGIESKIQPANSAPSSQTGASLSTHQRDKRIFDALDYITSSLIRLEEKLDELEQRLPQEQNTPLEAQSNDWDDDELMLDEDLITPSKNRSKVLIYSLIAGVVLLLIILGLDLAFPAVFSFLN
jgi:hypothetical protein